ncbi:uncharacterized protein LOC132629104 [Lycium barbarum]|uniref:uncharacterized protein LOC132629104 n=1 Tax=Lycium barbarum TaxID=112863 RepID=UPI00293F73F3|nr:uncharacterized protein LOC132629104 [Lycium barbarum]
MKGNQETQVGVWVTPLRKTGTGKNQQKNTNQVIQGLGTSNSVQSEETNHITNLDAHYNGRIWITWRPDYYRLVPVSITAQVVTCEVLYIPMQLKFVLSFVYAFNTKEERKTLWESLVEHSENCTLPWMILGDFNSVLYMDDRIGGNPITWAEVADFQQCMEECGLVELPQQGNKYTWNDRHVDQRIYSKIDRALINEEWLESMPSCPARCLPEGISNHCPLKVCLTDERARTKKSFKFCNSWGQHPQFIDLVKQSWETPITGCKMFQIMKKLKLLKKELKILNNQHFRDIEVEAKEDRDALTQAQQKSKAHWIKLGDDNTRYFYSVIKHKKLKQAVTQLKNDNGVWQFESETIAQLIVGYYEGLLGQKSSSRVRASRSIMANGNIYH